MFFTPNGCCLRKRRKRMLQFLFYLNPSFTKGGEKIKHPIQETILVQRGGVWSDRSAPQLQGASLFSCPPEAVPRARIPPGSRAPEGPLSSPGTPFSVSFRPLARPGGLQLAPTLTTSERLGREGSLDQPGLWHSPLRRQDKAKLQGCLQPGGKRPLTGHSLGSPGLTLGWRLEDVVGEEGLRRPGSQGKPRLGLQVNRAPSLAPAMLTKVTSLATNLLLRRHLLIDRPGKTESERPSPKSSLLSWDLLSSRVTLHRLSNLSQLQLPHLWGEKTEIARLLGELNKITRHMGDILVNPTFRMEVLLNAKCPNQLNLSYSSFSKRQWNLIRKGLNSSTDPN